MSDGLCTECGSAVLPSGVCSGCGLNAHIELEIAAFMAPHINRARIMLVVIGVLYAVFGYLAYGDIVALRAAVDRWMSRAGDPAFDQLQRTLTLAYVIVVFVMVAGVSNIVLAVVAGKKTMLAFNVALAIFIVYTCLQVYVTDGVVFTSGTWWITAIVLGMGYQAARKAHKLRTQGHVPTADTAVL